MARGRRAAWVAALGVLVVAAACSSSSEGGTAGPAATAASADGPTGGAGGLSPVGSYAMRGRTPGGARYHGRLDIAEAGENAFHLTWHNGGIEYRGVGIQAGELLATSYGDEDASCDVVLYRVGEEGDLAGVWTSPGDGTGTERALRRDPNAAPSDQPSFAPLPDTSGSGSQHGSTRSTTTTSTSTTTSTTLPLSGDPNAPVPADGVSGSYVITGVSPDGNDYAGLLDIDPAAAAFNVSKQVGGLLVTGSAIHKGDALAVGLATTDGHDCAVEVFRLRSDGTLHGRWGAAGAQRLGVEVATPD